MAYDSARFVDTGASVSVAAIARGDRLGILIGGASLGMLSGVFAALGLGRTGDWPILVGAPVFLIAGYFAIATFRDSIDRKAFGCAIAAALVAASLLAWPATALFFPMSTLQFWISPAAALGAMVLFASCWGGAQTAIYRLSGEAASLCMIAGFLGLTQLMS